MRLEAELLLRAGLALIAVAFLWTATAFLAFAAYALLLPLMSVAAAAALTGGAIILILALGLLINHLMTRKPVQQAQPMPLAGTSLANASASTLAQLAKDHPLLAVGCATLLGIADTMRSPSERVRRD
jgi:hypothetical protein